jgi:hypothetical protein
VPALSTSDPLAPLSALPGVPEAVARARDALVTVHNHKVNRRGWPATAAEAALRAARASAALDGDQVGRGEHVQSRKRLQRRALPDTEQLRRLVP